MEAECVKYSMQHIEKILKNIFKNKLEIDFDQLEIGLLDEHLLSRKIGLVPRDLLYLLRDIEKEFNIKIYQEDIGTGKFSTFNNISSLILKQV